MLFWFGLVWWHINHYKLFKVKSLLIHWTVLFQTIQFNISTQFSSNWPIDRILPSATTPGHRGHVSDGNKRVLRISLNYNITKASPSDCLVSYPGYSLREDCLSEKMQLEYSTSPANRDNYYVGGRYTGLWWIIII